MVSATDMTLGKLLSPTEVYVVPVYQRPYVWKADRNWQPLWDDIARATETWRAAHEAGRDAPTHFLGTIVVQQKRKEPGRVASAWVIDGQQRLTTLSVVIAAARAVAARLGADHVSGVLATMVGNQSQAVSGKHPEDRYKVRPLNVDAEAYAWAVRPPEEQAVHPPGEHKLVHARNFFEEAVESWALARADGDTGPGADAMLSDLQFALDQQMQVVLVVLSPQDDPQVIFEALNYRGVPLDAADLVKNQLFLKLEDQGQGAIAEDLLASQWQPLDGGVWREQVTTGRLKRARVDLLLAYWLTVRTRQEVVVDHLYATAKLWLTQTDARAADLIRDLRAYADTYLDMVGLTPGTSPTANLIDRMEGYTNTPWPTLLYLRHEPGIPEEQEQVAAQAIDSFLMRRAILRLTTKDYNRLFLLVLEAAQAAPDVQAGEAVVRVLAEQTADSRRWPGDGEIDQAIRKAPLFRGMYRARLKSLLAGINNSLYSDRDDTTPYLTHRDKLTVEHLMPQKWEEHWPLSSAASAEQAEERQDHIHRLGNLTLVKGKLNSSVSNKPWSQKKPKLQRHGLSKITSASVLSRPEGVRAYPTGEWDNTWDEGRIDARGKWLAERVLEVWPKPSPA